MRLGIFSRLTSKKRVLLFCILFSTTTNIYSYGYYHLTKKGYPLLGFMSSPVGRFDDYYNNLFYPGEFLKTKANFTMYPLSNLLYKFFSNFNVQLSALIFFIITSAFLFWSLAKLSNGMLFILLVMVSYPYHFTIARGNNEIILVGVGALIYSFILKREFIKSFKYLIALFLIEPYPYYVLTILLYSKVAMFKALRFAALMSLFAGALLFSRPFRGYIGTLFSEGSGYITNAGPGSTLHSSSLSGLIQFAYLRFTGEFPYQVGSFILLNRVIPFVGTLILILFFFKYKRRIDPVTSSILIVSGWTLLSGSSFDYRLLHFFIPLAIIFIMLSSKLDYLLIIAIMILFVPKPFLLFKADNNSIGETLGSVINPAIILFIIAIAIFRFYRNHSALPNRLFNPKSN